MDHPGMEHQGASSMMSVCPYEYREHYPVPTIVPSMKCFVCNQQAFGMNYGVPSCNACKMFFRRVMIYGQKYTCKENHHCYWGVETARDRPKCRACRFQRCIEVGMRYNRVDDDDKELRRAVETRISDQARAGLVTPAQVLGGLIQGLLYLDAHRLKSFTEMRSAEDPTIEELISGTIRGFSALRICDGPSSPPPCNSQVLSQWAFFGIWTSIEFLNCLDFMSLLTSSDKQIILSSFAMNSYLLSSAFYSASHNSAILLNPDGTELYSSRISEMPILSKKLVERVQKLLITKLEELNLSSEEYILMTVILFCTPRLPGMSQIGLEIAGEQQKKYSNALMHYCNLTRNEMGPVRFQELVSIGTVLAKCFDDVHGLVEILQAFDPDSHNSKKLFVESLHK